MNRMTATLIVAVIALVVGVAGIVVATTAERGLAPMTRQVQVEIYHQDSWARPAGIEAGLPAEERVVTMYVWKPKGLYVFKGDTVELTVINNAGSRIHSLVMPDFGVDTGELATGGGSKTVTFVADKVGTFRFACGVPYDPTTDPIKCTVDHKYQVGYFIVLDR